MMMTDYYWQKMSKCFKTYWIKLIETGQNVDYILILITQQHWYLAMNKKERQSTSPSINTPQNKQ